jgi:hypothetical protein
VLLKRERTEEESREGEEAELKTGALVIILEGEWT